MRVLLFGATGMVGQSVLRECLLDNGVESVLSIGRSSTGQKHTKLSEICLPDMFVFEYPRLRAAASSPASTSTRDQPISSQPADACFFCLGITSAGMSEAEYAHVTYDLTVGWARLLAETNPMMTFTYVSGAGTGSKLMWAQVKGRTEKALLELFPNAYMFRLGALRAMNGEFSKTRWTRFAYIMSKPLLPLMRVIVPGSVVTTEELGRAMIRVAREGASKHILENRDMIELGKK